MSHVYSDCKDSGAGAWARVRVMYSVMSMGNIGLHIGSSSDVRARVKLRFRNVVRHGCNQC